MMTLQNKTTCSFGFDVGCQNMVCGTLVLNSTGLQVYSEICKILFVLCPLFIHFFVIFVTKRGRNIWSKQVMLVSIVDWYLY